MTIPVYLVRNPIDTGIFTSYYQHKFGQTPSWHPDKTQEGTGKAEHIWSHVLNSGFTAGKKTFFFGTALHP